MRTGRGSERGHAHIELMIYVAVIAVGAALAIPGVTRLLKGEPFSAWNWVTLVGGAVLVLGGLWPLGKGFVETLKYMRED